MVADGQEKVMEETDTAKEESPRRSPKPMITRR
jgi:hypothetical protein